MMLLKKLTDDYLRPSRMNYYETILKEAFSCGYKMVGIKDFYDLIINGEYKSDDRILVNRHDIDTSPKTARLLFETEKKIYGKNGSSTYYFRMKTVDVDLIHDIDRYGFETGYHYEEISDFIKSHKSKDIEYIYSQLGFIRETFLKNLDIFRRLTDSASITVASHGDFVNTKLQLQNFELLRNDTETRTKGSIVVEAYDEIIMNCVNKRFADHVLEQHFAGEVSKAINNGTPVIMLLTHPRSWKVDAVANTKENYTRLIEGIKYSFY